MGTQDNNFLFRTFPELLFSPSEFNSQKFGNIQGCQK